MWKRHSLSHAWLQVAILSAARSGHAWSAAGRQLPPPDKLKVAVLGSGISGATVARKMAERGASVTVFEAGRGPGGRMSTRRTELPDGRIVAFDHGATYISPKGAAFASTMAHWVEEGAAAEWDGRFGTVRSSGAGEWEIVIDETAAPRYVGVPGMNSLPRSQLDHPAIETRFGTRIKSATLRQNTIGEGEGEGNDEVWELRDAIGDRVDTSFDVMVLTDRLMGAKPLTTAVDTILDVNGPGAGLPDFVATAEAVTSSRTGE